MHRSASFIMLYKVILNLLLAGFLSNLNFAYAQYEKTPWTGTPKLLSGAFKDSSGQAVTAESLKGKKVVMNFWATWCPPCVEEMPLLDRFYQENKVKGWQILGIAIDQPSSVRRFQAQFPVSYPLVLGGLQGNEFGRLLGNEQGSLPYTLVLDREGRVLQRKLGRLDPSDLSAWK